MLVPPDHPTGCCDRACRASCRREARNRLVISTRPVLKRNVSTCWKCFCNAQKLHQKQTIRADRAADVEQSHQPVWTRLPFPVSQVHRFAAATDVSADGLSQVYLATRTASSPACQPPTHLLEQAKRNLLQLCHVCLGQSRKICLGELFAGAGTGDRLTFRRLSLKPRHRNLSTGVKRGLVGPGSK